MPEGPEIRREADAIERALAGRATTEVWCALEPVADAAAALTGRVVTRVATWGKALLTHFEGGRVIYSHNQLYGKWLVVRAGRAPETGRRLRLALRNARHDALLYSASEIDVLDADRLESHPFLAKLGPDLLTHGLTVDAIAARLDDPRFAGRGVAALLLDQAFVAGLGNYLRAEILHTAGLAPRRKPRHLTDDEKALLAAEMLRVTEQSYATRGITNDLERAERLRAAGQRRGRYRFHVYGREGASCYRCDATVLRQTIGGRALFWCPGCQA